MSELKIGWRLKRRNLSKAKNLRHLQAPPTIHININRKMSSCLPTQHKQSCSAPHLRNDRGEAHVFPKSSSFPYGIGCTCCVAPTKVSITPSLLPPRDKHLQILYSSHSYLWVNLKIGIHRTWFFYQIKFITRRLHRSGVTKKKKRETQRATDPIN